MYAIAAPFPGTNTSLASLGYRDVGLDDVWQLCGSYGPLNWTYHDATGSPVVDTARFPNMSALPATAHSLGLTAGFYGELWPKAPARPQLHALLSHHQPPHACRKQLRLR